MKWFRDLTEVSWLPSVRLIGQIEAATSAYRRFEAQHILAAKHGDMS